MDRAAHGMSRRQCAKVLGAMAAPCLAPWRLTAATREWRVTGHVVPEMTAFDQTMETFMRARSIRSGSLAVTRGGRLVLARGYSWDEATDVSVQPTSLFRIASASKPVTAAAVMLLAQAGMLDLAAPITSILTLDPPPGGTRDPRLNEVTVLHLLQHLGGWDRETSYDPIFHDPAVSTALGTGLPITSADLIRYMTGQPIQFPPGAGYYYSNYGYVLLGRIVEAVYGVSYEEFVRGALLRPMGIERMRLGRSAPALRAPGEVTYDSTFRSRTVLDNSGAIVPSQYGAFNLDVFAPAGGWLASAVDLARFASAFDTPPGPAAVLTPDTIERTFAPPQIGYPAGAAFYGCGWLVQNFANGSRATWHNGALTGSMSFILRRPDGVTWAFVFNQRDDPADPQSTTYRAIEGNLQTAVNSVTRWPTHDLFPEYLAPPAA